MSGRGGHWNRAGRRGGGARPAVLYVPQPPALLEELERGVQTPALLALLTHYQECAACHAGPDFCPIGLCLADAELAEAEARKAENRQPPARSPDPETPKKPDDPTTPIR
jgi:hypothetical protein